MKIEPSRELSKIHLRDIFTRSFIIIIVVDDVVINIIIFVIRSEEPNGTKMIFQAECTKAQSHDDMIEEYNYQLHRNDRQCPNTLSSYYDPFAVRNYELPTVASKMKRVNRSYFNRFNFRNIPFVVGTSVTPSYNLGLNIQEVRTRTSIYARTINLSS